MTPKQRANRLRLMNPANQQHAINRATQEAAADPANGDEVINAFVNETRWCDQGCGYKLPSEYSDKETTCGACIQNEDEQACHQIEANRPRTTTNKKGTNNQ